MKRIVGLSIAWVIVAMMLISAAVGIQKVSAQLEGTKPAPQVVNNP